MRTHDPRPSPPTPVRSASEGIAASPPALRALAETVRQVAEVLEQTCAVLATSGSLAEPAPEPVPRAVEMMAADARAALLVEARALREVATALVVAADSYAVGDSRIAAAMGPS